MEKSNIIEIELLIAPNVGAFAIKIDGKQKDFNDLDTPNMLKVAQAVADVATRMKEKSHQQFENERL